MNAIVALKKAQKYADMLSLGLASVTTEGMDIVVTPNDGSAPSRITVPAPKDGVSITSVAINTSKELICTLSDGTEINAGVIPTIKGDKGNNGDNGLSAYEVAVNNGFTGTEQEWLESLKGKDGSGAEFENKETLEKLDEDENGNLIFSGEIIAADVEVMTEDEIIAMYKSIVID